VALFSICLSQSLLFFHKGREYIKYDAPVRKGAARENGRTFFYVSFLNPPKNKKSPFALANGDSQKKGDDILSHMTAVPSAQAGLTSLFGMGRGEPRRNNHLRSLRDRITITLYYQHTEIKKKVFVRKFLPPSAGADRGKGRT
jgi:hypothetical protein